MIVTVFRSRLNAEAHRRWEKRMSVLSIDMAGYISHKGFVAEDGECATIVEFESEKALHTWASHPEHVEAEKRGRDTFFSEYRMQVCAVLRESSNRSCDPRAGGSDMSPPESLPAGAALLDANSSDHAECMRKSIDQSEYAATFDAATRRAHELRQEAMNHFWSNVGRRIAVAWQARFRLCLGRDRHCGSQG